MIKPSIFQNIFKKHLKRSDTPLKKLADDIDPKAFEGYVTIRKMDRFGQVVDTNVVKNKLTAFSKSNIIRLLAQESTPWRTGTFNPAQYRINKIRFGTAMEGSYTINDERRYTGNAPIALGTPRDIMVPIYSEPADLQRCYYNLYEPSVRPGAPVSNDLLNLTLAQKKTAYTNLQTNAPKLSFQNISAATWNSGKIELSLGSSFTNFGLKNPLSDADGKPDLNGDYPGPFPNLIVDVYNTVTGKILQRLVFKNIDPTVAGNSTTFGADYPKGSFAVKPSIYIIDGGTNPSGFGNMFVKMPLHGTGATVPDFIGGAGDALGATFINNPSYSTYDLKLDPVAKTLYEEFTNITYLGDIESKLYFDFTQNVNGQFNGWKLVLDIAIGNFGEGIGSVSPSATERSKLDNGLVKTVPSADANWAQVNLGIGVSYDRGAYNIINSIVPKSGINNLRFSSNWNNNLNLDSVFTANHKQRFGTSQDFYSVGNLKGFTVGANAAFINDFESSYSIIMGVNEGNGNNPIDGVRYTEAFLCCENDDVFSALRFAPNDRFTKNNSSTYFITWSIRSPL